MLIVSLYSYVTSSKLSVSDQVSTLLACWNPDKHQHPSRVPTHVGAGCSPVTYLQLHMSKVAADLLPTDCLNALRTSKSYDGVTSQAQLSYSAKSPGEGCQKEACPLCQDRARTVRQHKPTSRVRKMRKQDPCLVHIPRWCK